MRRMFSGAGLFAEGVMFGLLVDGLIYLKTDETSCEDFVREGAGPFTYARTGRRVSLSYWRLPDRLYDDPDELAVWAERALQVALAKARGKPARRPPRRSKNQPS